MLCWLARPCFCDPVGFEDHWLLGNLGIGSERTVEFVTFAIIEEWEDCAPSGRELHRARLACELSCHLTTLSALIERSDPEPSARQVENPKSLPASDFDFSTLATCTSASDEHR